MKNKLFLFFVFACLANICISAQTSGTCGPNLTWTEQNGVLTISGTGPMNDFQWGESRWNGCSSIISVVINNGVTSIGDYAFYECRNITSVTIGNSVTSIGFDAFNSCSSLTSITIPNSVTSMEYGVFERCRSLTTVTIDNSATNIGDAAFRFCASLTTVTLGNGVTSIGHSAFSGCSVLTSITIPNSVTSIGFDAFENCSSLTTVTIGNSVTSIGYSAFSGCSSLTSPIYNSHVFAYMPTSYSGSFSIQSGIESIAGWAFSGCSGLTSITIPNSVTKIGGGAFSGCSGLTSITIPNSVTKIASISPYESACFGNCENLMSVTFESTIPPSLCDTDYWSDGSEIYQEIICDNLGFEYNTKIYVPCGSLETYKSTDKWSEYASIIQGAPSIIQGIPLVEGTGFVRVPETICEDTIEAIPSYGYHFVKWTDGNTDNPRVINPEIEATYTAEFAVDKSGKCGDDLLLTWTYDSDNHTLTISGNGTFNSNIYYGMEAPSEMTSLVIEDSVQSIGANAFYSISTLTSVTLGQDVSRIRENAFYNCENLTVIRNYRSTPATVYSTTFEGVDKFACTLYVPEGSVNMYSAATGWRDFFNIVGFNPTGCENMLEDASVIRKVFIDGHLYILLPDGTRFDATGRKGE